VASDLSVNAERRQVELLGADDAPLLARVYYENGDPGPIVSALAQVPELLVVAMPFLGVVLGASSIAARAKELVILRTSARVGCRFCVDAHSVVALDTGLSAPEVRALRDELPMASVFIAPADHALLGWVDAIATPGPVRVEDRRAVLAHFPDHQVVELTMVASATVMLNRFCTALNLPTAASVTDRLREAGLG